MDRWLTEKARVLAVEDDAVLAAADKASACGACRVKSGCGTSLLAKLGTEQVVIRALLAPPLKASDFAEGDEVELAIDRDAFTRVAILIYAIPLAGLFLGMLPFVSLENQSGQYLMAIGAVFGLFTGGWGASVLLKRRRNDERLQPIVVSKCLPSNVGLVQIADSSSHA